MKVKVFYPNREGKIEFTRQELEKLLDEVYREGQKDCNCSKSWTWTTPYYNGATNAIAATPNLSTATYSTDTKAIDNFKASLKEADTVKTIFDQKSALIPQKIEDVFSGLAKELNF